MEKVMKRVYLTALTTSERELAEENAWAIDWFLNSENLPKSDWFDVVVFGYLQAVEKWFQRPDLYRYEFTTIARKSMARSVSHEREKQKRRIQAHSIYDPIPGCDGLTWEDTITEENLIYTG